MKLYIIACNSLNTRTNEVITKYLTITESQKRLEKTSASIFDSVDFPENILKDTIKTMRYDNIFDWDTEDDTLFINSNFRIINIRKKINGIDQYKISRCLKNFKWSKKYNHNKLKYPYMSM